MIGGTGIRPERTLGLTAEKSELFAKADYDIKALVDNYRDTRIEFSARHLVANK